MKSVESIKNNSLLRFIAKNIIIFVVTLVIVLGIILGYIGISYSLKSPKMLGCMLNDYRLPFRSLSTKLYAKLYWDATLTQSDEEAGKLFKTSYLRYGDMSVHEFAAEKGNRNAQFYIGNNISLKALDFDTAHIVYPAGDEPDYASDAKNKVKWLTKAAEAGHNGAIDYINKHKDDKLYQEVLNCLPDNSNSMHEYEMILQNQS